MYTAVVIGAGRIGAMFDTPDSERILTHAHAYVAHEGYVLKGFYDVNLDRAKEAAERWQVQAFASLEEALEGVDVVSCTVPDAYHGEMLKKIAQFPVKAVFAEKPLVTDLQEGEEIKQLYAEKKIALLVNYTRRFVPEFLKLRKRIGEFGAFRRGCCYYGKGILHNGSHMIDLLRYYIGEVTDFTVGDGMEDFYKTDPSVEVTLYMQTKDGLGKFDMHPISCQEVSVFEIDFYFEKGRIRMFDCGSKLEIYEIEASEVYQGYQYYTKIDECDTTYDAAFFVALDHIKEVIQNNLTPICSVEDGIEVLRICKAIQEQYQKQSCSLPETREEKM